MNGKQGQLLLHDVIGGLKIFQSVLLTDSTLSCVTNYAIPFIINWEGALHLDPGLALMLCLVALCSGVKCCSTPPSSGQHAQLQLHVVYDWKQSSDRHFIMKLVFYTWFAVWTWKASWQFKVTLCFLCVSWFIFDELLSVSPVSQCTVYILNSSPCLNSIDGFSKDPTLTINLKTGSTWKVTGTGTTPSCLTSTNTQKLKPIRYTRIFIFTTFVLNLRDRRGMLELLICFRSLENCNASGIEPLLDYRVKKEMLNVFNRV